MSFSAHRKPSRTARKFTRPGLSLALTLVPALAAAQTTPPPTPPLSTTPSSAPARDQVGTVPAGQSSASAPQAGGVAVRGSVTDPDTAVIPGATITLTPASGSAVTATSGSDGSFAVRGVPPGVYSITITMPGFASFVRQGVRLGGGPPVVLNAKLAIQDEKQVVNVTATGNTVSVDQDSNASATVLTGKDLDALSDDPDELSDQLTALAGPAAGPNGGQIYIDGFTGGQLPPKSSIREIRINQNPFSAEYDRAGFGRVEIFTKPGTDKFHGSAQLNGADKAFNTGSPFIGNTPQPGYHTILFFGSLTGPVNKNASFAMNGSYRQIQNNSIVNPPAIYSTSQTSGVICAPGQAGCSIFATATNNGFTFAQFTPQNRWDVSPRLDLALGSKNTLTARFSFTHNAQQNLGIGNNDLQSTGYNETVGETTIQISDSQILSSKVINETRFEYQRPTSSISPFSTSPTVTVQGAFTGGGDIQQAENDTQNHIEVQNYTSVALAKNFIRFGGRLRSTGDTNYATQNANGQFTYTSIANYQANILSNYQVTNIANPTISSRSTDLGLYAETDWKPRPNLTFSYGIRFETQNYIRDHHDFAPRVSLAYGLGKKTVLRAGGGFFYDRFMLANQLTVIRNNGVNQQQYTASQNSATGTGLPLTCTPSNPATCPTTASRLTINTISDRLRAPYSVQLNLGLDRQLFQGATFSANYQHIRGIHQFNSDAPNASAAITSSTTPLDYQFQSEGEFNQNQLIANVNYRGRHGSLFGFYALNFAKSDSGGIGTFASTPNNLRADYGRASFDVRNRVFMGGSLNLPHLLTLSPLLVASSGSPYNITAGLDPYNDNQFNTRAVFAPANTPAMAGGYVKTINGCGTFATPGTPGATGAVPINYCTGPANFTANLRVVKTFGFGGSRVAANQQQGGGPGGPGGPGGGRGPGGGERGGGGRGGPGGGYGGGGASSGQKYNLSIGVIGQNIFNVVDRSTPVGTLTSPSFGTSTQLTGTLYTTDSAVRRVQLQASFTF